MKWFEGSIPEAIALAKAKQQVFLVFIEGSDELSQSMCNTFENADVSSKLQGAQCVAIRLKAGSEPCQQFSQIYPVVVVPSSFFIGCNGIPLEVIAGSVGPQELLERIESVVQAKPSGSDDNGNVASEPQLGVDASPASAPAAADKVERAKRLLEERRLQKLKEEEEATKRSELERRRVARELQLARQAKEDGERREWAQKRAQEKEEERRHREAIQAQIAQDRADRAERYQHERAQEEQQRRGREAALLQEQQQRLSQEAAARSLVARIQFRLPDGSSATHTFDATATLQDLRNFVLETIRPGFSSFSLSTTFPRKEFTHGQYSQSLQQLELTPSAVLLVVPNQAVVPSVLSDSGVSALKFLGSLLTPLMFLWSLLTGLFFGSPAPTERTPEGVAPDPPQEQGGARRRRPPQQGEGGGVYQRQGNVYRFSNRRSSDDDDESNTWNGNSTQQM